MYDKRGLYIVLKGGEKKNSISVFLINLTLQIDALSEKEYIKFLDKYMYIVYYVVYYKDTIVASKRQTSFSIS